jgi:hypothetical protein
MALITVINVTKASNSSGAIFLSKTKLKLADGSGKPDLRRNLGRRSLKTQKKTRGWPYQEDVLSEVSTLESMDPE